MPAPRARRSTLERLLVPLILALTLALAGCLGEAGGEIAEPSARSAPQDETVPEGHEPSLTVFDMSGELLAPSVGIFGTGNVVDVGTVPSGEDHEGTVLIDFQPDLGPTAMSVSICIGAEIAVLADCEASEHSTGEAVQLDGTGLSGQTIFIRTDYGAGSGTTYVLCVSVFDFQQAPDDHTAIIDGHCHDPAALEQPVPSGTVLLEHPVSADLVIPFYVYYVPGATDHCASEIVEVDGPITTVNVTATWAAAEPLVPDALVLRVYEGTGGEEVVAGHEDEDSQPIAEEKGTSPLTVHGHVEGNDTVRLRVCQRGNFAVAQDFDVHLEGSIRYLAPAPEAT